jgi:hypothetical protein
MAVKQFYNIGPRLKINYKYLTLSSKTSFTNKKAVVFDHFDTFQPSLMFEKNKQSQFERSTGLLAFLTNSRQGLKVYTRTNSLTYLFMISVTKKKV